MSAQECSWPSSSSISLLITFCFFFSSRRRHTRFDCDWSSDVCSSDLELSGERALHELEQVGLEPQQDGLGLRVAEPAVELQRLRIARLVDHQAGVQEEIGRASCRERV